jgi:hypothetical protein
MGLESIPLITGPLAASLVEGWGRATTTLARRRALAINDFILNSSVVDDFYNSSFKKGEAALRYV